MTLTEKQTKTKTLSKSVTLKALQILLESRHNGTATYHKHFEQFFNSASKLNVNDIDSLCVLLSHN